MLAERDLMRSALKRAAGRIGAVRWLGVSPGGFATYAVGSSRDEQAGYRVTVDGEGTYRCTCPSELRPACWHRAACHLVRAQRMAGGMAADGAAIERRRVVAVARLEAIAREFDCA